MSPYATKTLDLTKFDAIVQGIDFPIPTIPESTAYPKVTFEIGKATIMSMEFTSSAPIKYGPGYYGEVAVPAPPTPSPQFTFEDFARALAEVVMQRGPRWTYPSLAVDSVWHAGLSPVYRLADGTAACLIGAVLDRLDRRMLDSLPTGFNGAADMMINFLLPGWFTRGDVQRIAHGARMAQVKQDHGFQWIECETEFHRGAALV